MNQDEFYRMIDEAEGRRSSLAFPALMRKVYTWMALALAITGITSFGVATSPNILQLIFGNQLVFFGLCIAELVMVIMLSARLHKMSLTTATLMFVLYSVLNGVTMASIFLLYTMSSIATTFFICSGTFAAMAFFGYTTKRDLSTMGRIAFMALIGLIIATVVNIFVKSSGLDLILSYLGVLIFVGLTAWDTQKIKMMLNSVDFADEGAHKLALIGSLTLYLDFINMFIHMLRIFGSRE